MVFCRSLELLLFLTTRSETADRRTIVLLVRGVLLRFFSIPSSLFRQFFALLSFHL